MNRKNAFTLIELLVVITIIMLLIGLTAPSLRGIQRSAQGIGCQNNLRQLYLAFTQQMNDNDGRLVVHPYWWFSHLAGWSRSPPAQLHDYIAPWARHAYDHTTPDKSPTIATCPTLATAVPPYGFLSRTYAYNLYPGIRGSGPDFTRSDPHLTRFNQIRRPSEMMTFCDSYATATVFAHGHRWFREYGTHWIFTLTEVRIIQGVDMPYAHDGRANVVFMDGHVEALTRNDYRNRTHGAGYATNEGPFWRGRLP